MSHLDNDFATRAKRLRARSGDVPPTPVERRARSDRADDTSEHAAILAILRPQLALLVGAIAMIAGRALSMNYLGIEPSADLLSLGEGVVVFVMLFFIGLLFGKSDILSHGALAVGAALAFLAEGFIVLMAPELMSSIYKPEYVAHVLLFR